MIETTRRTPTACLLLAAAAGAAYASSPLTVIFAVAMFFVVRYAVRGLEGAERRWVLGVLTAGLLLRVLALAALFITLDPWREQIHALFGDGHYSIQRSEWILNDWQRIEIGPWYRFNVFGIYAVPSFDRVLAALQWFIGPSPHALPLVSVGAFFGGVVLLYRLARRSFGSTAALAGLAAIVFWPTFFIWSITMLKESAQLFFYAVGISCAVTAVRVERWDVRALLAVTIVVAALLNAPLRGGSHVVVLGTVATGYLLTAAVRRSIVLAVAFVGVVVIGLAASRRPEAVALVRQGIFFSLDRHIGNVKTPGIPFKSADERFYVDRRNIHRMDPPTPAEEARFLIRSMVMFVLVPLPAHIVSPSGLLFVPEQIAWLLLLAFAVAGALIGLRRAPLFTSLCIGHCVIAAAMIAPYSGNVGTLVRHRDLLVPIAVWLSGLGVITALNPVARIHHAID